MNKPITISTLQFLIWLSALIGGAGVGWGTLNSQMSENRAALARIEVQLKDFDTRIDYIHDHQIVNEKLIDDGAARLYLIESKLGLRWPKEGKALDLVK